MLVILSQKVDSTSSYADELFRTYHYPARYKNQLHKGDTFVYCQGNRYDKGQRYYFGTGTVGEIMTTDDENYYAELIDCCRFEKNVPIYLPDGGYIEQLGFETVRKNINPPWQSSIRPLSRSAFDYILHAAGTLLPLETASCDSINVLKDKLKSAIRDFYVEGDNSAIHRIESIASAIAKTLPDQKSEECTTDVLHSTEMQQTQKVACLLDYCKSMKMSYSYKPILILALLHSGDGNGCIAIEKAASFFRTYYAERKARGLPIEKKRCIYLKDGITNKQIVANLLANPVKALVGSGYFFYDEESQVFFISPDLWREIDGSAKAMMAEICHQKLRDYYSDR